MEPPVKINSISIDLAKAPDGIDSGKCEHFSIRWFVAEIRGRDHRKCWPFSEDSVELGNHESYSLPTLSVVKSRWWRCGSCVKDINVKKINDSDCGLQSHSRSVKETKLINVGSSAVPSRRRLNWLSVSDKKTKKNHVQKTATLLKKVRRRANSKDASTIKSKKSGKLASPKKVRKKRSKESREAVNGGEAVTAFGSSEIAGVVDDTPDKATKKNVMFSHVSDERDNNNVSPQSRKLRKTRKVRLLSELISAQSKETPSKRPSRGRKRKSCGDEDCTSAEMTNYASRILSTMGNKTCDDNNNNTVSGEESRPSGESLSTDSGFNKEGKQRLQQVLEAETAQVNPYDYASFPGKELVPCPLHTQRTEKEIGLDKKRKRKAPMTDHTNSTIITFSDNMDTFPQPCPRNTMPQSTRDFLNSKWLDSSFDRDGQFNKFPSQFDDGRPLFPLLPLQDTMHHYKDADGAMLKGIGTNHFRNFGSSFNSTNAEACLRTGVNVNFSSNVDTFRSSSSSLTDKLSHISSAEVPYGSCSLQKDISTAHGKGKASEHIDDIPMEIVELMAKNQYERCLPDREEDKQPTTSVSKNALLIDLNETYDNSMDNNNNNTTRQPKPLGKNVWNSDVATKEGQFMAGRQWISSVPFGVGNPPLTRDNQPSSIQFSGVVSPNSQRISSLPANQHNPFRVLRPCNTCQSVQQQQNRDASSHRPVWVSPTPAHKPVSLNMQKFMDHHHQSTKLENPNTRNLNFTDNGKQKLGLEGVGNNRSLDTFSSESSIPAMHLLSLMDPRLRSNVPVDQSRNASFAKPPVHQSQPGDCNKTAYSTKQWPFDLYSKRVVTPETSRGNLAIVPPVGTSSISFQSEMSPAENADFRFQASWNHHQEKNSIAPCNNSSHHKPVFTSSSSDPGKFQLLGASDSMKLPLKYHMKDNAKKHKSKNHNNAAVSACPPTTICGRFVCSVSRNPADFTILDAPGNVYMIKGEDLKVSKQPSFRKKQNLCKQDALMQNKVSFAPTDAENA